MRSPGRQRSRPTISKIRLIAVTAGHDAGHLPIDDGVVLQAGAAR
ncbi:hypothetical protein [Streptomyces sp. AC555_RSS877]|nr:hypothetical protein [Streptomyces sp. AC555_RSS877]